MSVSNQSAEPLTNNAEHRKTTALSKIRLLNTSWNSLHQSLSWVSLVLKPNHSHFKPKCEMPSQTPEGDTQEATSHPYLTTSYNSQMTSSRAEAEIPILKMSSKGFLFLCPYWSVVLRERLCHLHCLKTSLLQILSLDVWTFNPLNWSHHDGINTGEPPQKRSLPQFTSTRHWASSRNNSNYQR